MNLNLFPKNNAFKFSSWIEDDKLQFDETLQEVAVEEIFIDSCVLNEYGDGDVFAIKSNICYNSLISSSENSLLCVFSLKNIKSINQGSLVFTVKYPIYFSTFKTNLLNAQFEVWNLDKNKCINVDANLPTFIIISIKNRIMKEEKMESKLLYLDSNDFTSKQCFKNNNNSSFSIQLPHYLNLKDNATACLRSIFIPNLIRNIEDNKVHLFFANGEEKLYNLKKNIEFESSKDFIKYLNIIFTKEGIMFGLKGEKLSILKSIKSKVEKIKFSSKLRMVLGFSSEILSLPKSGKRTAQKKFNLNLRDISFLVVEVDIVEKTIFGEKDVGILKILPLQLNDRMVSSYYFSESEKKRLKIRNFSQITIKILTDRLELVQFLSSDIGTKIILEIED